MEDVEVVDRCDDILGIVFWSDMGRQLQVSHFDEENGWLMIRSLEESGYDFPHLNPHFLRRHLLMTKQDQGKVDETRAATEEDLTQYREFKELHG